MPYTLPPRITAEEALTFRAPLELRKRAYGILPWEIGAVTPHAWNGYTLKFCRLAGFRLQREAMPILKQLQAIPEIPWGQHTDVWPEAIQQQVWEIIKDTPGEVIERQAHERSARQMQTWML